MNRLLTGKFSHPLSLNPMEPDPLLRDVEAFLGETGMAPTAFGLSVMRDARFVPELRRGRELRRRTAARVREQMAYYRRYGKFGDANGQDAQGQRRA